MRSGVAEARTSDHFQVFIIQKDLLFRQQATTSRYQSSDVKRDAQYNVLNMTKKAEFSRLINSEKRWVGKPVFDRTGPEVLRKKSSNSVTGLKEKIDICPCLHLPPREERSVMKPFIGSSGNYSTIPQSADWRHLPATSMGFEVYRRNGDQRDRSVLLQLCTALNTQGSSISPVICRTPLSLSPRVLLAACGRAQTSWDRFICNGNKETSDQVVSPGKYSTEKDVRSDDATLIHQCSFPVRCRGLVVEGECKESIYFFCDLKRKRGICWTDMFVLQRIFGESTRTRLKNPSFLLPFPFGACVIKSLCLGLIIAASRMRIFAAAAVKKGFYLGGCARNNAPAG